MSAADQVLAVRSAVGGWIRDDLSFIRIVGTDAASWLHSQTTNDVESLASGDGCANALLDRQGRLQCHFTLHRWEDEFWLIVERSQKDRLLEQFDSHLFIEEVELHDAGDDVEFVVLQGPRTMGILSSIMDDETRDGTALLPRQPYHCHPVELAGFEVLAFLISYTGEDGYLFVTERGESERLLNVFRERGGAFGFAEIGPEAREILRIEAGMPVYGVDMDEKNLLPETTLERTALDYDKGCFLGQEVVARLKAYGSPKRALMGIVLDGPELPSRDSDLFVDGRKAGTVKSSVASPTLGKNIALIYLDRDHRNPGQSIDFSTDDGPEFNGTVTVLPFYEAVPPEKRAETLYNDALEHFEKDLADEDASAIPMLKEAVLLHPTYEDAYEVLGVVLNRHHRVDEAIHYMQRLAAMNPNCMMAHTNLSVFYVQKGMIEEAEKEKAEAAVLAIQQESDARRAEEIAQEERGRIEADARNRIAMFTEVLEIDDADPVATFGMGAAYIQLNEYDKAIPYLERATEVQKDYSAAYLNLGKCYEFENRPENAREAYRRGIAVAARKGDLMPLREMESRLKTLEAVV